MNGRTEIRPQPGPQTQFLASPADIAIIGGAAGGGKTWDLLVEPLRHIRNPNFGAVIFRRTTKQVTEEGGLWDESWEIYPKLGALSNKVDLKWTFPPGSRVGFAHLEYEKNLQDWDGAQIPLIEFDQLEHFTERMFFYMLMRNRSTCGVKPYVRASCNPDPDSWLASFLEWWIDQDTGYPIPERAGVLRWFVRVNTEIVWSDSREDLARRHPDLPAKSLTFIPSTVYDNKILLAKNPGYLANLMAQGLVERGRFLEGNWKIRPAAGKVFNRAWFEIVDAVPGGGVECRFWDFASTKKALKKKDPDFTAGVKIRAVKGVYYVTDCWDAQEGPAEVEQAFLNLSRQDADLAGATGARYKVRWEEEPGSASRRETLRLVRLLAGLDAGGTRPQGDKLTRARALASQARVGNVKLLRGPWNERWLRHMHGQPELDHDDIMDGSSGSFNELTESPAQARTKSRVVKAEEVFR